MGQAERKSYKYTQNYPTERKDYGSGKDEHPSEKTAEKHEEKPEGAEVHRIEDAKKRKSQHEYKPVQGDPEEGGKIPPDEAERISSGDLPS